MASQPAPASSTPLDEERWHARTADWDAATVLASSDPARTSAAAILQAGTFGGMVGPVAQRRASAPATSRAEPDLAAAPAALKRPSLGSAGQVVDEVSGGASAVERAPVVRASSPDTPPRSASSDPKPAPAVRASQPGPVLLKSASAVQRASLASIGGPGGVFSRATSFNTAGAVKVLAAPGVAAECRGGSGPVPVQGGDPGEGLEGGGPSPVSVLSSLALQQAPLAGA